MTDPRKTAEDAAFERELSEASRAYRAADGAGAPPSSMDDAIRAAARRAVQAAPRAVEKPWLLRFSKPLSVAAVLVLTASLLIVSFEERPELAPPMAEKVGKIALPSQRANAPAESRQAGADVAVPASRPAEEAPAAPPVVAAARRMELAPVPEPARRADSAQRPAAPAEVNIAASAPVAAPAYAPPPVQITAAPMPAPAIAPAADANRAESSRERRDSAAPVALAKKEAAATATPAPAAVAAVAAAGASAGTVVTEAKQAASMLRAPAVAAAPSAAPVADSAATFAPQVSPAPARKIAGATADLAKAAEPPEAWLRRIIALRQQMKPQEADEELARFRKRYPDFVIPTELKAATGNR